MFLNVKKNRFLLFKAAIVFIFFNNSSLCKSSEYEINIEYKVNGKQLTIEGTFINFTMGKRRYPITSRSKNKVKREIHRQHNRVR